MKVELVKFYVKPEVREFYNFGNFGGPRYIQDYAEDDERLAIYLGEDKEHIWLLPLSYSHLLNDDGAPKSKNRIIIMSVARFVKDDVVLIEPPDHVAETFGYMLYKGESRLD